MSTNGTPESHSKDTANSRPALTTRVTILVSGGFRSSYEALIPVFAKTSSASFVMEKSPSEGNTHDAVAQRLGRGEAADVLIMVGSALQDLETKGYVLPHSRVDLALSPIGCAVKSGAEVPDINDDQSFRKTLLAAKSIAYSDSASGQYIESRLFKKLGIESEMKGKARQILGTPVGEIVAKGQAELGFQEVAELLPVPGITFAGKLPADLELLTLFSAGVVKTSQHVAIAKELIAYLSSRDHTSTLQKQGLEPLPKKA